MNNIKELNYYFENWDLSFAKQDPQVPGWLDRILKNKTKLVKKNIFLWGLGDDLEGKMFAMQIWGLVFDHQNPHKTGQHGGTAHLKSQYWGSRGKQAPGVDWLASLTNIENFRLFRDPVSKNKVRPGPWLSDKADAFHAWGYMFNPQDCQ